MGANSNVLTIVGVTSSDAGSYRVLVFNSAGSTASATATLTVKPQSNCTPAPPGLVAWYKGEGNAQDSADSHQGQTVNDVRTAGSPLPG